ncbi:AAA family ATPase [Aquimarina muelleri]|uniref:NadR/Ttd14 AAA domain-containing protein n=1 Tax=Aquimarina muelleri TaxID=279356 RepID=A0A918JTA1_9FLAO|nr:AAA family ATPase [Aquimarina muelleri]MCX2762671.1 AAA family ATPase [Aquimarina muelleri]GGX05603.1 hypothetical protein GCM10007384_04130 [Aquimarina muelleri]
MHKRYIITGAPGTGKTSLIHTLEENGYSCFEEISRKTIIHQQKIKSNKTPWEDLSGFADLVYQQTIKELDSFISENTFVDRGLPDIIAYLKTKSYSIPEYISKFPFKTYYSSTVFFLPLWKEIYVNDPQRPQSYPEAEHIHYYLTEVYLNLGFTIKIVPKTTLTKRVDFIRSII